MILVTTSTAIATHVVYHKIFFLLCIIVLYEILLYLLKYHIILLYILM
jgi:hypothetical protein